MRIATIGYEGATLAGVLDALAAAGIETLVDVRARPSSRRPGFSRTPLSNALAERGIGYVHLRALGTPPAGREAARKGRHDEMAAIYREALHDPDAIAAAAKLRDLAGGARVALLCFEREPAHCHRQVLIDETLGDADVEHLFA